MPRQPREKSANGVYHVMLRGINKQDIFIDGNDYRMFLTILKDSIYVEDESGQKGALPTFRLYTYCLMSNHVHLLIQEIDESISLIMKRIGIKYAYYFNTKYMRVGHLFQNRFRSEPCDDVSYFLTLVRYIHQNPVKAGICQTAEQYAWSSWNEIRFAAGKLVTVPFANVCDKEMLFKIQSFQDLDELVHLPIAGQDDCIDIDNEHIRLTVNEVRCLFAEICGTDDAADFKLFDAEKQKDIINRCLEKGVTIIQLSNVTGFSRRQISRLSK